ncbi:hypothetical protein AB3X52_13105 [Nocardioides sp. DS6]|uniref:Uncharacterized protein n=1 Tax=Nocardioides eburneus TaxID=3231482 RepID=A0ABV3T0C4_9ACTN
MTPLVADEPPVAPLLLIGGIGVLVLLLGVGHYRGWQKSGLLRVPFDSIHFMPAWFGAAIVIVALGSLGSRLTPWFMVLAAVGFIPFAVALVGLFWLPDRLLPAWYVAWRGRGRPADEVASRADRAYDAHRERRAAEKAQERAARRRS